MSDVQKGLPSPVSVSLLVHHFRKGCRTESNVIAVARSGTGVAVLAMEWH